MRAVAFCILEVDSNLLVHKIGRHSHFSDLTGMRAIGFRRYIDEYDIDLFGNDQYGIKVSASREICRNVCTMNSHLDDREIQKRMRVPFTFPEKNALRLTFVVHARADHLPRHEIVLRRRLDVNRAHWANKADLSFRGFDRTSTALKGAV